MTKTLDPTRRQTLAWQMRQDGKTFREIADALGATPGGAQTMSRAYERKLELKKISPLPIRARNALKNLGIDFGDPAAVARDASEVQLLRAPNMGRNSVKAIKRWLAENGLALRVI